MERRIPIGTARIAHRAVVHQIGRAVRPEADGGRAINATHHADKRLLGCARTFRRAVRVVGLVSLPDFVAADHNNLVRVLPELTGPPQEAYFVYPEELRSSKRISVFRDFLLRKVAESRLS